MPAPLRFLYNFVAIFFVVAAAASAVTHDPSGAGVCMTLAALWLTIA